MALRDFETADKTLDRAIAVAPQSLATVALKGYLAVAWKGDLGVVENQLSSFPADIDPDGLVTGDGYWVLTLQSKFAEALAVLQQFRGETLILTPPRLRPKSFLEGTIYLRLGDKEEVADEFERARVISEQLCVKRPKIPLDTRSMG